MNIVEKIPEDPKILLLTMELNRIAFEREMVNARQERERNQNDSDLKRSSVKQQELDAQLIRQTVTIQKQEQQIKQLQQLLEDYKKKVDQQANEITSLKQNLRSEKSQHQVKPDEQQKLMQMLKGTSKGTLKPQQVQQPQQQPQIILQKGIPSSNKNPYQQPKPSKHTVPQQQQQYVQQMPNYYPNQPQNPKYAAPPQGFPIPQNVPYQQYPIRRQ